MDGHDGGDERCLEAKALGQESVFRLAQRDFDAARARFDHVARGRADHHEHKDEHARTDELGEEVGVHRATWRAAERRKPGFGLAH